MRRRVVDVLWLVIAVGLTLAPIEVADAASKPKPVSVAALKKLDYEDGLIRPENMEAFAPVAAADAPKDFAVPGPDARVDVCGTVPAATDLVVAGAARAHPGSTGGYSTELLAFSSEK